MATTPSNSDAAELGEPTRPLLLIRHAAPAIVPGVPAREWRLSDDGAAQCATLGARVATFAPVACIASDELKARQTAEIIARQAGVPLEITAGLHEHERGAVPYFESRDVFDAAVAAFFRQPDILTLGEETATQALARFQRAVDHALARHTRGAVAIVTHGTVLSLFVGRHTGCDPLPFWRSLGLPALIVMSAPAYRLLAFE